MKSLPELNKSHPAHPNENIRYCLVNVLEHTHNYCKTHKPL